MGDSNVKLASLIASRICHDLISPIGAITNGLELLELTGGVEGPEMELIADSVGNAGALIRFFRIAYGAAGDQLMGRPELAAVLDDLTQGGRLVVKWGPLESQPRSEVRLAFLALQCLETAMPYGGKVLMAVKDGKWTVSGQAEKLNIDEGLWDFANRSDSIEITPALVQFALLSAVSTDMGRAPKMSHDATQITLHF